MKASTFFTAAAILAVAVNSAFAGGTTAQKPTASRMASSLHTPKADKGCASLIIMYTGDDGVIALGQDIIKLKKAMKGYKKVVLLKHNHTPPWLDLSEKDEKLADVIELPTKNNLIRYLKQLTDEGYFVDLYWIGHGNRGKGYLSQGTYGSKDALTADDIRKLPSEAGYSKLPIRMVWSTLCYGQSLNSAWLAAGAKVVGGSRHVDFYPSWFGKFADEWVAGESYRKAVKDSDTAATRTLWQALILADAKKKKSQGLWNGCKFGKTVLGKSDCAKEFFTKFYLAKKEWKNNLSGKKNMTYSSEIIIAGDTNLTSKSHPKWN